jgi:vacuolar-type H+-ATPase subunit I/STV1
MSVSVSTESDESFSDTTTMASNISNTSSVNNDVQIDTSLSANNSRSDSDEIADQILAKNMQEAQNEIKNKQEQTGEYGSEDKIIAYMGYVVGFNDYRALSIPNQELWYESKNIYTSNTLLDNRTAFNGLFNQNIKTLVNLKAMQPNL